MLTASSARGSSWVGMKPLWCGWPPTGGRRHRSRSVTNVVLTQMHMDHVGGLLADGVRGRLRQASATSGSPVAASSRKRRTSAMALSGHAEIEAGLGDFFL